MDPQAKQPPPRAHAYHRSPYAKAAPRSETVEATRPDPYSSGGPPPPPPPPKRRPKQQMSVVVPLDDSELMSLSAATLSSYPLGSAAEATGIPRSAGFDTALYDPSSDSVHILPHTPRVSADSRKQESTIIVGNANKSNRSKFVYSPSPRRRSFDLPLRTEEPGQETNNTFKVEHIRGQTVDLMAAPPGRKRSHRALIENAPSTSVDANPSEALTKQIASSVRQERHGNRRADAAPVKAHVQDLPPRPGQDTSSDTGQGGPPHHWGLPSNPRSWINHARSSPRSSGPKFRTGIPSIPETGGPRTADDEDDPFQYDRQHEDEDRRSRSRGPGRHWDRSESKPRAEDGTRGYPCPFRRRNPVLFNIRDYENCAKRPFSDIAELRRHLKNAHRNQRAPYQCPRCKQAFITQTGLSDHLTVPLEEMCEAQPTGLDNFAEDGITEDMARALSGSKVHTWEEIWHLLFPHDSTVLDPEFLPVVEIFEAEEEFDDSAAELKEELYECLKRVLPDQSGDALVYNVLAGQIQLVFEQHRAKVTRRFRNNLTGGHKRDTPDKSKFRMSRFSISAGPYGPQAGGQRASCHPTTTRARRSQAAAPSSRPSISPSSSVYSRSSSPRSSTTRPPTRSSSLSVESPRLPFRDWVQGAKVDPGTPPPLPGHHQRDSGLAMQCDECGADPCRCHESYADQLSAFLTPASGDGGEPHHVTGLSPYDGPAGSGDEGDMDWATHYVDEVLSNGGLLTGASAADAKQMLAPDAVDRQKLERRSPVAQRVQPEFI